MLALIENKWDVKFIQILPAPTEGVFEILGKRKILENCFKNIIWFFLDQASSSSDPPKILILQFLILRASLSLSSSLSNLTLVNWNPSLRQSSLVFLLFLLHSTTCHYKYWIYKTICQVKPVKFVIKLYTDHNTLWVKHATHQKAESLRASSFSKLDNTVSSNSIFKVCWIREHKVCLIL